MTANRRFREHALAWTMLACGLPGLAAADGDDERRRPDRAQMHSARDDSGVMVTISTNGFIDRRNPFFRELGTNERSCVSCHRPDEGWSMTPKGLRERFAQTDGTDPVFRPNDGAVSPLADVSTRRAREKAYGMLLGKGLIRIGIGIPAGAEFELLAVDDPYGFASAAELSLFRRPLASTNLRFLSTVMWDGRETFRDATSTDCLFGTTTCFASLHFDLADQANAATMGHAQGTTPLTTSQRDAIVDFELGLFTAQQQDDRAGRLAVEGAHGGPTFLSTVVSYFGINDTVAGDYRSHASFTPTVMTLYTGWQSYVEDHLNPDPERRDRGVAVARQAIARGEALFNGKPIVIRDVKGLNDDLHVAAILGTCSTCHNTPNAGDHSVPMPLDIGIADASRRTPDLPLYTLRNKTTGAAVQTTDPGRALITGRWQDIGRFKGPTLRALAARAPYFHNGSAQDLNEVVSFYNDRFGIGFTDQERDDLVAFLKAL
ncbi:MAG TPA: cytochrome C [Caldimonas sp.]|nr:cytochrome C [Caldimonas sp.]HEX4234215.1 cytochrome C [Caldimonas sp.]